MLQSLSIFFITVISIGCGSGESQSRYKATNTTGATVQTPSTGDATAQSGTGAAGGGAAGNPQTGTTGGAGTGQTDTSIPNDGAQGQAPANADGCALALTSFTDNIAPGIGASCINCHGAATPISGAFLSQADDVSNRDVLLAYDTSADGSTLFGKISGEVGHAGGVLTQVLSQNAIATWKTAEQGCVE